AAARHDGRPGPVSEPAGRLPAADHAVRRHARPRRRGALARTLRRDQRRRRRVAEEIGSDARARPAPRDDRVGAGREADGAPAADRLAAATPRKTLGLDYTRPVPSVTRFAGLRAAN